MKQSRYNFILYHGEFGYWYNALSEYYFRLSYALSKKVESLLPNLEQLEILSESMYRKLCTYGFIISQDIDELDIIRRRNHTAIHSKDYFLVILPTLNCNFSCWCCIQEHVPSVMSGRTIEMVKKHIDYMIVEKRISSLHLDWFGGEPFMSFHNIIKPLSRYAMEKCEQYNVPFINSSTTNGYYINLDVARELNKLHFSQFQITLDGEKKFHDKVKFMKGCSSAFERVLYNINSILEFNPDISVCLRINYTHETLSHQIVTEVNEFISMPNRARVIVTPKKVWQEDVDKNFGCVVQEILDDFEKSGYQVSRRGATSTFTSCYVSKEYFNAINYNGNVVKCTACDDIHKEHTKGKLLENGQIVWEDDFDKLCQKPSFENPRCLSCNKLPLCMGLCPRDYLSGFNHCKYDVMDEIFEDGLLESLIHQYQ